MTEPLLQASDLTLRFGGNTVLDGVSFDVREGELFAVIGPNGAGKTSTFNCISGVYRPQEGTVTFRGRPLTGLKPDRVAGLGIARTFQNIELFEHASVLQNLLVGRHVHKRSNLLSELLFLPSVRQAELTHRLRAEEVIDLLDLQHYRDQLVANLPYGVRKVVELGRALCTQPKLLLLDEPASGLNVEETQDMAFWIEDIKRELGITIIMVEHDMGLVSQVSDRVLALADGRVLAQGSASEVQQDPAVVRAYLGSDEHA